uniref:MCF.2 cell line derived transforming sequence like n=1 Tax=Saimiri boliviensis boliviensis TaxID=39432 RepID=A0A2K6TLM9_SAIBB
MWLSQRVLPVLLFPADAWEPLDVLGIFSQHHVNAATSKSLTGTGTGTSDARTSVILQDAGIGFILVIDRRRDKWTSVKASVLRIAN